jgi:hypothetical protein
MRPSSWTNGFRRSGSRGLQSPRIKQILCGSARPTFTCVKMRAPERVPQAPDRDHELAALTAQRPRRDPPHPDGIQFVFKACPR